MTLAQSLISESLLHLYLSFGGNFEHQMKSRALLYITTQITNLPFYTDHIPISNSSNMAIIIAILLTWDGREWREDRPERGKRSTWPFKAGVREFFGGRRQLQSTCVFKFWVILKYLSKWLVSLWITKLERCFRKPSKFGHYPMVSWNMYL